MNAILWLRVSSQSQDETNQLPDLLRFCAEHGLRPVTTVQVHGKSAWKARKLDTDKAAVLAALRAGVASVVVCWSVDRWSRGGIADLLDGMRAVKDAGGRVLFVKDAILNQPGEVQELLLAVLAWVARWESGHRSDRVTAGMERRRGEGAIMGGKAPTGYKLVQGARVRDENKLKTVAEVFERCAGGQSVSVIRAWLRREGMQLSDHSVRNILRNPVYAADGVISPALARAAVDALEGRRKGEARLVNGEDYSRMLRCACGAVMHRKPVGGTVAGGVAPTIYYRCSAQKQAHPDGPVPMVRRDDADDLVEFLFANDVAPWMIPVRLGGDTREADVMALKATLKNARTRAESDEIWDSIEKVLAREPEPERTEWVASGRTRGDRWQELTHAERRSWLESEQTRVVAWNDKAHAGDVPVADSRGWCLGKVRMRVVPAHDGE